MKTQREEFGYVAQDGSCWQVLGGFFTEGAGASPLTATDGNWFIGDWDTTKLLDNIETLCQRRPQRQCEDCGALMRGPARYCNTNCEARDKGIP